MKLEEFKTGEIIILTERYKQRGEIIEQRCSAVVTCLNYNGNGMVTYTGTDFEGLQQTGSGAFYPEQVGKKEFGFSVKVEKTGKFKTLHTGALWSPRPGDRSYDLMC